MNQNYLTEDECNEVLNNYISGDYKLTSFTLEPFCKERRGYLGVYLLLTLNVETQKGNRTFTFFVKSVSGSGMQESFDGASIFNKEVIVYKIFKEYDRRYPQIKTDTLPKMYYYNAKEKTLVLENLGEKKFEGYAPITYDKQHALVSIEALAKFHASSIAYEEFMSRDLGRVYEIVEDFPDAADPVFRDDPECYGHKYVKSAECGAYKMAELTEKKKPEALKQRIRDYTEQYIKLLNEPNNYRKVISHGDLWGYNLLFKYNSDKVPIDARLVDFQLHRYAPPAHDITFFIYMTTKRQDYHKVVHEYYNYYYARLSIELKKYDLDIKKILPLEEYQETCKLYMPVAKYTWLVYRTTSQSSEEAMQNLTQNSDLSKEVIIGEKRAWWVETNYKNDPIYRYNLDLIFKDIKDMLMLDHICIDDCFKIVQDRIGTNSYEYIGCELKQMDQRVGFLGDHYNLYIKIKRDHKEELLDYFVKLAPQVPLNKEFVTESGALLKERRFYSKVVTALQQHEVNLYKEVLARAYLAEPGVLIFENLKAEGYKICSVRQCMDLNTFKIGLSAIAKLHAAGFILEERLKQKLNTIYPEEFKEAFYTDQKLSTDWRTAGKKGIWTQIKSCSNFTSNITPKQFMQYCERFVDAFPNMVKPSSKYRNTICHGDLWGSNMMFQHEQKKCILVDFQSYRYAPPTNDLMQYLYMSTDRKFRELHETECLNYYYVQLQHGIESYGYDMEDILPYQDFLKSCEEERTFAIIQTVTHFHTILMSPERAGELFNDPEFCGKTYFVDKSEHIEISSGKDPCYKERAEESIRDLRELCEKVASGEIKSYNEMHILWNLLNCL